MFNETEHILKTLNIKKYGYKYYTDNKPEIEYMLIYDFVDCPFFLSRVPNHFLRTDEGDFIVYLSVPIFNIRLQQKIKEQNQNNFFKITGFVKHINFFNYIYLSCETIYTIFFSTKTNTIWYNRICLDTPDLILKDGAIEYAFTRSY